MTVHERQPAKTRFRAGFLLALRAIAAVVLIAIVLRFTPPQDILATLRGSSPQWLLISVLVIFGWRLIAAQRLREFTRSQGMAVRSARLFAIALISSFFGTVTPGYAFTGVVRWYLLSEAGRHKSAALAALFNDRLTDLTVMIGMGLCGLMLTTGAALPGLALAAMALFLLLLMGWFASGSRLVIGVLPRIAARLPHAMRPAAQNLGEALGRFSQMSRGTRVRVLLLSIASNAVNAFGTYCLIEALNLPLSYYDALWLRCAVYVVGTVPLTIMGLGLREGALIALLAPAGIIPQAAVALSVLILGRELIVAVAGGLTLAFWRGPSPLRRPAVQS